MHRYLFLSLLHKDSLIHDTDIMLCFAVTGHISGSAVALPDEQMFWQLIGLQSHFIVGILEI
ncbi:MAG: hypothetical protein ACR5K4_03850 [Sodalis sp. (in: enterobacteria)]